MAVQRPLYHLGSARSPATCDADAPLFLGAVRLRSTRNTPEGERVVLANAAAMNYGFAFRLSTYASLRRMLGTCFGAGRRLVRRHRPQLDLRGAGQRPEAVVHRHNPAGPSRPAMMRRHPAFGQTGQAAARARHQPHLVVPVYPGGHADRSLYSACHGAGTVVGDFARSGALDARPGRATRRCVRLRQRTRRNRAAPRRPRRGHGRGRPPRPWHRTARRSPPTLRRTELRSRIDRTESMAREQSRGGTE